jgi:hypothetical protein
VAISPRNRIIQKNGDQSSESRDFDETARSAGCGPQVCARARHPN